MGLWQNAGFGNRSHKKIAETLRDSKFRTVVTAFPELIVYREK